MMSTPNVTYRWRVTLVVFFIVAVLSGATVAGPGLTWDETPYEYSQIRLQQWLGEIAQAESFAELIDLFSADSIDFYFVYNKLGSNFHPPMAGYLNLITYGLTGGFIESLSARRLASSIELALTAALVCHFLGRRFSTMTGVFAAFALATTPRVFGDSHIAGTDIPIMLFWTAAALAMLPALSSRWWQVIFAVLLSCLFLVKFSGNMIIIPVIVTMSAYVARQGNRRTILRALLWSLLLFLPLVPLALTLFLGKRDDLGANGTTPIVSFGMAHRDLLSLLFLWPAVIWFVHRRSLKPKDWPIGFELPWMTAAVAPLVVIALNPTWWHDPVGSLSSYFDLNLRREGYLPDILIFYLGKQYLYSLPWHNAWVLMALTIPFGILALGMLGTLRAFTQWNIDWVPLYFVLHAFTLPLIRMLDVPAHDGVRLFLPTFVFWAGLAAIGARWIALNTRPAIAWPLLFIVGPAWGGWDIARIHPYELSYYNVGLPRAQRLGMEVTYWYDAVTPSVLRDLNERLPEGAVLAFPSPNINPEIFVDYQSKGKLRGDIVLDVTMGKGFPYMLLLTHSSKANPFSQLLAAMTPWYSSKCDGVPLFSVVDPHRVAVAWGVHLLSTYYKDPDDPIRTPSINERMFQVEASSLYQAVNLIAKYGADARHHLVGESEEVAGLVDYWTADGQVMPDLAVLLSTDRPALEEAIEIIERRPDDVRLIVTTPGYLPAERFGGYLDTH